MSTMRVRCVRLAVGSLLTLVVVGGVLYTESLRCLILPCNPEVNTLGTITGPDPRGNVLPGNGVESTSRQENTLGNTHQAANTRTAVPPPTENKSTGSNGKTTPAHKAGSPTSTLRTYSSFAEALRDRADANKVIILLSVDAGYIDMALNILETSLLKLGLNNFLFVCSDDLSVQLLREANVSCFLRKVSFGKDPSNYGSLAFVQKTHVKTHIIREALQLGYTVFILDVDIMIFKNPMPYFDCASCDIQIQTDGHEGNTGFYLVRPTKAGIQMHSDALYRASRSKKMTNQMALDRSMERMMKGGTIHTRYLDVSLFPHGLHYFEKGKRAFAGDNPCEECVMVHNNWMVSGAAKTYRFKEQLMWAVDRGQYYSSTDRKYLTYENPLEFGSEESTIDEEKKALRVALSIGHLLQRVVILPAFHCFKCRYDVCKNPAKKCPLNTHVKMKDFDQAFNGTYREHVFLQHPKVPAEVKQSLSDVILINSAKVTGHRKSGKSLSSFASVKETFTPADPAHGANSSELLQWLKAYEDVKVLRFHSLYDAFKGFDKEEDGGKHKGFLERLSKGIKKGDYRQY